MKLTNKQKLSIWKSLNLNEDFFDDKQLDIYDETGLDLENGDNQQYTYHFQFIFYLWPLIKHLDEETSTYEYYFENPEYKPIVETVFITIKKLLDSIMLSSRIVTNYSKPKFCTLSDKFISIFPFMDNEPSCQLFVDKGEGDLGSRVYKEVFNGSISLEMTLNLSDKKNRDNIEKLLYSFYKLDLIYNSLIKKINTKLIATPPVTFGYFKNNPFAKMGPIELISPKNPVKRYSPYMLDILLINPEELKKLYGGGDKSGFQLLLKR